MQTVFITGANGFVGYYLAQQLLQNGSTVLATGKGENRLPFQHTRFIYKSMDFTSAEAVAIVFKSSRPAIVIHCGAMSKPDECELKNREIAYQVNVGGTLNLLNEAKNYKSHFRSGKG